MPAEYTTQWRDCPGCDKCRDTGGYILRRGRWRCTTGHSSIYQFALSERYFCSAEAAKEASSPATAERNKYSRITPTTDREQYAVQHDHEYTGSNKNPRTVWRIPPESLDLDLCLKCGRVWKTSERKQYCRKVRVKGKKVWRCDCGSTEWGSHYAAFPAGLPRKIIPIATPEHGCCPYCGMPWAPVVEKERTFESGSGRSGKPIVGTHPEGCQGGGETLDVRRGPVIHSRTTGHRPSCACAGLESAPAVVLDPFLGTGTVAAVAVELGRKALGIELNPLYVPFIEQRVLKVLVPRGQAEALPAAGPLFED